MAFVLTILYLALSLLSPSVLPEAIWSLHVNIILGIATILVLLPQLGKAHLRGIPDTYFVFGLLLSAALSTVPLGFSAVPGKVMEYLPIFIVFYFVVVGCRSVSKIRVLIYVLLAVALFVFCQGWFAFHGQAALSPYLVSEGRGDNQIYRFQGLGVLSDPNDLAQLFTTMIPLLFLRWKKGSGLANFLFTLVPAMLLATGLYYTHSRGGAIALVAVCLFGFREKIGMVLSSMLAVGLFAGMMALNISGGRGMNDDDGGRVAAWSTGLEIFKHHPLIGIGIDRFAEFNETGHTAHNSYILCLSEVGLVGYFCWMGTIVSSLTGLSQMLRAGKNNEPAKNSAALPPPHQRFRPVLETSARLSSALPLRTAAAGANGYTSAAYVQPAPVVNWAPTSVRFGQSGADKDAADDADLIYMAKILRIAFVGLLTSAFFLSRSFSMVFYIMVGIAGSVRLMYLDRHPEQKINGKEMLKRVLLVIVVSVLFLYLFVRIHGV